MSSNDTPNLTIFHAWVIKATFVKGSKIQSWKELEFVLAGISKDESGEKRYIFRF